jgi:hypothetical protein
MKASLVLAILVWGYSAWLPSAVPAGLESERGAAPREFRIPAGGAELYSREIGQGMAIIVLHGGPDFDQSYLLPRDGSPLRFVPPHLLRPVVTLADQHSETCRCCSPSQRNVALVGLNCVNFSGCRQCSRTQGSSVDMDRNNDTRLGARSPRRAKDFEQEFSCRSWFEFEIIRFTD